MSQDSLKRLIVTLVTMAINLGGAKLGLGQSAIDGINLVVGIFLAQSGVNAAIGKFAAGKAGQDVGAVLGVLAKAKAAFDQAQAAANAQAGAAAGAAVATSPSKPSQA
jgi:hypothetical protein